MRSPSFSDANLARAWIALQYASPRSKEYEDNFWAHMELDNIIDEDAQRALNVINKIQIEDNSEFILANIAAGPLESLLVAHGETMIEEIERISLADSVFKNTLKMVWKNDIRDDVWRRIRRLLN